MAVEFRLLTAFWVVSISLVLVPGADWAYAISAGLSGNAVAFAIAGMLLGYLAITLVVAAGVGALVAAIPVLLTALTFAGAGYLLWLGANVLIRPPAPELGNARTDRTPGTALSWSVRGFVVSGLNPKAFLLFLALLPQFTSRSGTWSISAQIGAMGIVHMINCALVYSGVGVGSKIILRSRPKVARKVSQISGAAMIAIATLLIVETIKL